MKVNLLQWLVCPECSGELILCEKDSYALHEEPLEIEEGNLQCVSCKTIFPIINSIPRFVLSNNYTDNFGFQWNLFRKTQLDSYSQTTISNDRFFYHSGWNAQEMKGSMVLDAGCGAGRFVEVALATGAIVIGIDYSRAVDACWENLKANKNFHLVQADIYKLPFKSALFDYVYSFGVLQHTPAVKEAFFSLVAKVKLKGKISVDFYRKDWKNFFWPKYWLRPLTKNLPAELLFNIVKRTVPFLLPISHFFCKVPKIGYYLKYLVPVANYAEIFPLDKKQLLEWSILDTFDMFSPKYDFPQSEKAVKRWFKEAELSNVKIFTPGFIVGQGVKKTG